MLGGITLVCPVVMVALLPADFVIDTAMLPYDLYQQFDGFPPSQDYPQFKYIESIPEPSLPAAASPAEAQDAH
ncbi:hypothetical protein D3C85_1693820 [compost metagenome]